MKCKLTLQGNNGIWETYTCTAIMKKKKKGKNGQNYVITPFLRISVRYERKRMLAIDE